MYTCNTKVLGRTNSSPKFDAAIGMWEYQDLLNAYYGNNKILFNYVSSSIYGSNAKDSSVQIQIRQYVYDMLEEGYPVILHIVDEQNDKKKYYTSNCLQLCPLSFKRKSPSVSSDEPTLLYSFSFTERLLFLQEHYLPLPFLLQ